MSGQRIQKLEQRVNKLEAEADIRRIQARYMMLCDTPCPVYPPISDHERIELIVELYTEDAVWEGVGEYYTGQFGRAVGKDAIREHFNRFYAEDQEPQLLLNAHYLTSEQIDVDGEEATGAWIHMQPWLFSDGTGLIRSSRLNNAFRKEGTEWLITRTRTENVFVAPLPNKFAEAYPQSSVLFDG